MRRKVAFVGSKQLGLAVLSRLQASPHADLACIVTIDDDDEPGSRGRLGQFREAAKASGTPLVVASDRAAAERALVEAAPELCVVCGWYWLIGAATLAAVPGGCMAIHHSRLPLYRGNAPVVWAMINGEREVGLSLFRMTPGLDDGPLWGQETVPVGPTDAIADVLGRLEQATLALFGRVIDDVLAGRLQPRPQAEGPVSYCAKRRPADGLIDWSHPADRVYDFIRAQSEPYPGAFSYHPDGPIRIWRTSKYPHPYFGTPGQLARAADGRMVAICGDNRALVLEEVERAGVRGNAVEIIGSTREHLSARTAAHA